MVTRQYIENIREQARLWQPYDQAAAEQALRQYLQLGLPDWDPAADSLLSRSIPLLVDVLRIQSETAHAQVRRGLLAFAEGPDLDLLGLGPPPVFRFPGEADDDYRVRIANAQAGLNIGALDSIEQDARLAMPIITDVAAITAPNRQDVSVFAVKAGRALLTATEATSAQEYLNARDGVIAGVQITVRQPTEVPYTIRVRVRYDASRENGTALSAVVRSEIYKFLAAQERLGSPVYRSAIYDAAYVSAVERVEVIEPEYDLAPPYLTVKRAAGDTTGHSARVEARVTPDHVGVASAPVTAGGTGYVAATTTAAFTGGVALVAATATVEIAEGVVTGLLITDPGVYSTAPTGVAIADTGGGSGATADLTTMPLHSGDITVADVLDPGGDYTATPIIELLPGIEGTGAAFTVVMGTGNEAQQLASVTVTNGGRLFRAGLQYDYCPLFVCPATDAGVIIEMVAI